MRPRMVRIAPRSLIGIALLVASAICVAGAVWVGVTGGFRLRVPGLRLSVTSVWRLMLWALVLGALGLWIDKALRSRIASGLSLTSATRALTAAAAVLLFVVGLVFGTKAAGGADVHGYVSEAYAWIDGNLKTREPLADAAPWPDAVATFAPLGYRSNAEGFIVPTYSPGIPLLMAALILVFGSGAEYWLTPLCGGALVLSTYALGKRVSAVPVAGAAALCIASSPLIIYMTCWLLGDLPAATFWTAALWLALRGDRPSVVASGLCTAVAILIRPNLVPLAVVPLFLSLRSGALSPAKERLARCALFVSACAPAMVFVAWVFDHLYGSPLRSGYGPTGDLFKASNAAINLRQYPTWIFEAHGPFIFLFPLSLAVAVKRGLDLHARAALCAIVLLVFGCYVTYSAFDAWWYTRFLLPAFPAMFILAADAMWNVSATRRWVGGVLLLVCVAGSAAIGIREAVDRQVTSIGGEEQKYARVGDHVRQHLPHNAVVYAMQHTGNIRHYSRRRVIRWDVLDPAWLDRSVTYMRAQGYEPYFLLDDWEVPLVRTKFASQQTIQVLDRDAPSMRGTYETFVYALDPGVAPYRVPRQAPTTSLHDKTVIIMRAAR